jgi:hypothetical protein
MSNKHTGLIRLSRSKKKIKHKDSEHSSEADEQSEPVLETKLPESKNVATPNILQPQTEKETISQSSAKQNGPDLHEHIKSKVSNWYWITVALTLGSAIAVLIIGEVGPLAYIRYISASILVLFLPGYAFLRALSPLKAQNLGETNNMNIITRLTLSIVLSIAMVSVLAFILDFSPLGVSLDSLVLSLSLFTLFFSTLALFRERRGT